MSVQFGGPGQARRPKFAVSDRVHVLAAAPRFTASSTLSTNLTTTATIPELLPGTHWQITSLTPSAGANSPHLYTAVPITTPEITVSEPQLVAARFLPGDDVVRAGAASKGFVYRVLETKVVLAQQTKAVDGGDRKIDVRYTLEDEMKDIVEDVSEAGLRLAAEEERF